MIQKQSYLKVADNTGAKELMCIGILCGTGKRYARIGDIIIASVKKATPGSIVKKEKNPNPKANLDSVVYENPRGTRVFGPVARELRETNHLKILSLAPEVL